MNSLSIRPGSTSQRAWPGILALAGLNNAGFPVSSPMLDFYDVLEFTVYDEDKGGKKEFLGALVIPVLDIKDGQEDWYVLKKKDLVSRAEGEIKLKFRIKYKTLPAYLSAVKLKEQRFMLEDDGFKVKVGAQTAFANARRGDFRLSVCFYCCTPYARFW